jgi:hypothetical protein
MGNTGGYKKLSTGETEPIKEILTVVNNAPESIISIQQ